DLEGNRPTADQAPRQPVERFESPARGVLREVLDRLPDLRRRGSCLRVDVEGREPTAVEGVQVAVLLDLLAPHLLDRENAEAAAFVFRRDEAHDAVAQVVEARLPAALEDVQHVLLAALDEVPLQDRDQACGWDAVMLGERVNRVDQDERPLRQTLVDEVVRCLEFREIEAERDLEDVPLDLARADGLWLLLVALLALLELAFELVQRVADDLRLPRALRTRLETGGGHARVRRKQRGRLYIGFPPGVRDESQIRRGRRRERSVRSAAHPPAWRHC